MDNAAKPRSTWFDDYALPSALLGTAVGGTVQNIVASRRAARRAKDQEERILRQIDTGASEAKLAVANSVAGERDQLQQTQISRGTVNTSLAPGQQAQLGIDAGGRLAQIEQERSARRVDAMSAFGGPAPEAGSAAAGQAGNMLGVLLASRAGNTQTVGGSDVEQKASMTPAIDTTGGDPSLSADSFRSSYDTPGAGGAAPIESAGLPLGVRLASGQRARAIAPTIPMRRRPTGAATVSRSAFV